MKIRTITAFPDNANNPDGITETALFLRQTSQSLQEVGLSVQTTRIAAQGLEQVAGKKDPVGNLVQLDALLLENRISFFSTGPARSSVSNTIVEILQNTETISIPVFCSEKHSNLNAEMISAYASACLKSSEINGLLNFRLAAICNCPSGTPFFPAAYGSGENCFSIGMECSDLVMDAFSKAGNLVEMKAILSRLFLESVQKIERVCEGFSEKFRFHGTDVSVAPSVNPDESIALAMEKLLPGKFGGPGTLEACKAVTDVLQKLPVKKCGYSGLMLPVLEDYGLALRASELDVHKLLLFSSVCGTGLDTVPVPGDVSQKSIEALVRDVAAMSLKLDKPLSVRLFPVKGKKQGQKTEFNSPYLVNSTIFAL